MQKGDEARETETFAGDVLPLKVYKTLGIRQNPKQNEVFPRPKAHTCSSFSVEILPVEVNMKCNEQHRMASGEDVSCLLM